MSSVPRETLHLEKQIDQLVEGCKNFGLQLNEIEVQNFTKYLELILRWNQRMNLISRRDTENIALFHFLDSLSILAYTNIPTGAKMIDVGSGAGFPGLPLKVCRPDVRLTLVESIRKKVLFLTHVVDTLSLEDVTILKERAEILINNGSYRCAYDIVVSRAVSHLRSLVPLCLPFLKPGGMFVAFKGGSVETELQEARSEIRSYGSRIERREEILLPISQKRRQLVIMKKL
jgi:16S rRNA (guanine527-N7)-methyltransferase